MQCNPQSFHLNFHFEKKREKSKIDERISYGRRNFLKLRHRSRRSKIFGYGRRPLAFGPTLEILEEFFKNSGRKVDDFIYYRNLWKWQTQLLQFVNIAWVMKTYYVFELFVAFFSIEFSKALECQNQNNVDYCMIKGYNRDQFPPYPPLNVSFNFDVKVRIFIVQEVPKFRDFWYQKGITKFGDHEFWNSF